MQVYRCAFNCVFQASNCSRCTATPDPVPGPGVQGGGRSWQNGHFGEHPHNDTRSWDEGAEFRGGWVMYDRYNPLQTWICMHVGMHPPTCACSYTDTEADTDTNTHTHTPSHAYTCALTHTDTGRYTCTHTHIHACTHLNHVWIEHFGRHCASSCMTLVGGEMVVGYRVLYTEVLECSGSLELQVL